MGRSLPGWAPAHLALLLVAVLLLYGGALDDPFHYDDHHSVADNPASTDLSRAVEFLHDPALFSAQPERAMYRPLVLFSYALTNHFSGGGPGPHHAVNLGLHVVVAWLVGMLAAHLATRRAGLVAAGLFLVHPLAAEPAVYISARSESLAWIAGLLSILLFRRVHSPRGNLVSAAFFAAALMAKSTLLVLPGVLWSLEKVQPSRRNLRRQDLAPHAVVGLSYLAGTSALIRRSVGEGRIRGHLEQLWAAVEALIYQGRLVAVPHPLSVEHPLPASLTPGVVDVLALGLLASVLVLAGRSSRFRPWLLAAALPLVPPTVVPLNAVVSEHRLYGSLLVLALALAVLSAGSLARIRGAGALLIAALLIWAGLSRARLSDWDSETGLWQAALRVAPQNGRAHFFLGDALRRSGDGAGAQRALAEADRLLEGDLEIAVYRAAHYLEMGQPEAARPLLEPWLSPQAPARVTYNLGLALKGSDPARALDLFARALANRPGWRPAAMELALQQDVAGNPAAAIGTLQGILADDGDWAEGWLNLGYFQTRVGDLTSARRSWERALQIDPSLSTARQNLRRLEAASPR